MQGIRRSETLLTARQISVHRVESQRATPAQRSMFASGFDFARGWLGLSAPTSAAAEPTSGQPCPR